MSFFRMMILIPAWADLGYPGAASTTAAGIDGQRIVGAYADASGSSHGFLLTTPEPATTVLLAFGGVALLRQRR